MLVLVFLIFLRVCLCSVVRKIDPTKIDYCEKTCTVEDPNTNKPSKVYENSACDCRANTTHTELLFQLVEFRKTMLELHNSLRNKLALGKVKHKDGSFYPNASNMRALSYSLEVEYIARCYAVKIYDDHDECRDTIKHKAVGQNVHFADSPYEPYTTTMWWWWKQFDVYNPKHIDKYELIQGVGEKAYADFTQLAWAEVYTLGCARSWNLGNYKFGRFAVLCNYESMGEGANKMGAPVYAQGPSCSGCPEGTNCNPKYTGLCGRIDQVPMDRPPYIYKRGEISTTTES
ncbi:hypothetical protein Zmor_013013 [Zophobas morio]|uniref:SCP domain-containing protein n=2 Tax=Zophobas morio TaxID=2755281 RepID=A0AA38IEW5_9CUCU|nr:hypothetical protein Zmor_013013 [Zophobas morio]